MDDRYPIGESTTETTSYKASDPSDLSDILTMKDEKLYGIGKPRRIIIKAKITHDQDK